MELLKIDNLNITIGSDEKIKNCSMTINSGDVVLLTGPNGCGKSTIIKLMMSDVFNYQNLSFSSSEIIFLNKYSILKSERDGEFFRKHVCYVSQEDSFESDNVMDCFLMAINYDVKKGKEKYIFDFIMKYDVQECFGFDADAIAIDGKMRRLAAKLKIKADKMTDKERKAIKYLSMSIRQMSGGQKKLTNIMTNLIRFEFSNLLLLDEPLNNLDYGNVRSFSNVLTRIFREKPELGIILVTHCRSLPIVNRVIEIDPVEKGLKDGGLYTCNSCFGKLDENGLYC